MKKLYSKGTVHPITTPPLVLSDQLSLLPATILTLFSALPQEDRQVLAYLVSCYSSNNFSNNLGNSTTNKNNNNCCYCFNCYMSYWIKWDSSPNRQLIHEIIDAFEDMGLQKKKGKSKKHRRNKNRGSYEVKENSEICESDSLEGNSSSYDNGDREEELGDEKGSVRRFVSFLGESLWSIWNI
ncbi:uncharacterized protein LOC107788738 [Nicotiana tabacum]|uniref:Uncharacterized protein n=2 Tax=Nicotiana tabacum TaxID=4097 RepID=A0A1S3ZNQ8_TOBAC|nr:PREDICTED: uncharacterized protein LOC107788738 [Nicotiana tabacum]